MEASVISFQGSGVQCNVAWRGQLAPGSNYSYNCKLKHHHPLNWNPLLQDVH